MPMRRWKLSLAEAREHRTCLLRLNKLGIEVGGDEEFLQESERFRKRLKLVQVDEELAKIYDLPGSGAAVVLLAKLIVVVSKVLMIDYEMTVAYDELPLNLDDPKGSVFYPDLIAGLYPLPLTILNSCLTGESALCHSQREGVIIARGQRSVPSEYHDHAPQKVELSLWDERDNELRFTFRARVDRSLKRKYERQQAERSCLVPKRQPLFKREDGQLGDQKSVVPEEAVQKLDAGDEHDATCNARPPETKLGDR